ncbi:MAG: HU family DNA-binding protein [Candidatus Moranbacteria bacterium]|nr:HU family DNA-binding protein [Candidatus Moranbacteria bacterium]
MKTLNKYDLAQLLTKRSALSKKEAIQALENLTQIITEQIKFGKRINIVGFGSFQVKTQKGRTGYNPRSGEKIIVADTKVVKFKPGSWLKKTVRQN